MRKPQNEAAPSLSDVAQQSAAESVKQERMAVANGAGPGPDTGGIAHVPGEADAAVDSPAGAPATLATEAASAAPD